MFSESLGMSQLYFFSIGPHIILMEHIIPAPTGRKKKKEEEAKGQGHAEDFNLVILTPNF